MKFLKSIFVLKILIFSFSFSFYSLLFSLANFDICDFTFKEENITDIWENKFKSKTLFQGFEKRVSRITLKRDKSKFCLSYFFKRDNDLREKSFFTELKILDRFYFFPGIVNLVDFSRARFEIVTELGIGDLLEYILRLNKKRLKLSSIKILYVIKKITESVRFLHDNRVIHRDLKPENIVLFKELVPKLIDFSMALELPENKSYVKTAEDPGSLFSYPPDFLLKKLENNNLKYKIDCKYDIYALGSLLYFLIYRYGHIYYYKQKIKEEFIKRGLVVDELKRQIELEAYKRFAYDMKRSDYRSIHFVDDYRKNLNDIIKKCWSFESGLRPTADEVLEVINKTIKEHIKENDT